MSHLSSLKRMRRGLATLATAGAVAALASLSSSCNKSSTEPAAQREVLLGGLLSLTGGWPTLGQTGKAAMELAVDDVNEYLQGNSAQLRFVAAIEDTRLDPALALEKAKALRAKGAQLLIGAQSSAEVQVLKPFVDANGLLLVSPSSTAASLAVVGDNVFRLTPGDSLEGVAVAAMMWDDGIRAIIPVWRNDEGSVGLAHGARVAFGALGGTVLEGVRYENTTSDFRSTVADVNAQLQRTVEQYGPTKVAVYLAGFDEMVALFTTASSDPVVSSVRWYGSDGLAHSEPLLKNSQATQFALGVRFLTVVFGMEEGARDIWTPLAARIRARTNLEPDAFALAIYDAVWVVARGYVASGSSSTLGIEELKAAFTTAASTHFGATGWTVLNAAGDRKYGDFDFWGVRETAGVPAWSRTARYETRTGRLVR